MSINSMNVNQPSFRGIYKITAPKIDQMPDGKEKDVYTNAIVNSVLMGFNYSVEKPRINKAEMATYYKIDDKNDAAFEKGFNGIISECNKALGGDIANKVYMQKVDEAEFNKAEVVK